MTEAEKKEIKNQIKELQAQLRAENCPLVRMVETTPFNSIRYNERYEKFYFANGALSAWPEFLKIAKSLFLIERETSIRRRGAYIICDSLIKTAKKTSELTKEQKDVAVKFLNEVIPIYNKYFMEYNKEIIVDGKLLTVTETEDSINV